MAPYKEVDISSTIKACRASLEGRGGILRPRREAVNLPSEAHYEGAPARPPYIPFVPRKLTDAPLEMQAPAP